MATSSRPRASKVRTSKLAATTDSTTAPMADSTQSTNSTTAPMADSTQSTVPMAETTASVSQSSEIARLQALLAEQTEALAKKEQETRDLAIKLASKPMRRVSEDRLSVSLEVQGFAPFEFYINKPSERKTAQMTMLFHEFRRTFSCLARDYKMACESEDNMRKQQLELIAEQINEYVANFSHRCDNPASQELLQVDILSSEDMKKKMQKAYADYAKQYVMFCAAFQGVIIPDNTVIKYIDELRATYATVFGGANVTA